MRSILRNFILPLALLSSVGLSAQCTAGFTYSVSGGTVSFTNTSTGAISPIYTWNFGDSQSGYGTNTAHTYSNAGTYYVCLTLSDSLSSCTSTFCDSVAVTVGCNNLQANIASSTNASACTACDGSITGMVTGGTAPYSYMWSNSAVTTTISSLCTGNYSLTVTDANGCTSNAIGVVSCPQSCHASFVPYVSGNWVYFTNTSNDSSTATFNWDFGDSNWASGVNASHTYASPGTYVVFLHMVDSVNMCSDTYNDTIVVGGPTSCGVSFSMMPDSFNTLQWYAYPNVSGQSPFTYLWDFGDASTSTLAYPTHTYATAGSYNICLTITDANNCTSMYCDSAAAHRMASQMQYFTVVNVAAGVHEQDAGTVESWPNPVNDMVWLSFSKNARGTIRITDLTGKTVLAQTIDAQQVKMDVSALPAGIYSLSVSGESMNWNKKIVVIHQ